MQTTAPDDKLNVAEAENILTSLANVFLGGAPALALPFLGKQKRTHHEEMPNAEARYRILVEQIPAVVFMAFIDKAISEAYVSPQIERLLGFTQQEWLDDPVRWYHHIHPDDKARWSVEAAQMFLTGEPLRSIYRVIARDGRVVWFHCEAKMVRHADGRPWFVHGVGFDITEVKQAEALLRKAHDELEMRVRERTAELARANEELQAEIAERIQAEAERADMMAREQKARWQAEEANRLKDEFLASVSHELRTPLTAVLGWTHILRTERLGEEELQRALEIIERNANSQRQLIDDLLDMSRIITGKIRLDVQPIDPVTVVNAAIEAVRHAAEAKQIRIEKIVGRGLCPVPVDATRLQQVIWNLLSNAIKFTQPKGEVRLSLERANAELEITVTDTGVGIKPEFLPFVFDRFRQGDGTTTRRHGGLGLGLAIVRHLVELHGGSVQAESAGQGCGATFKVRLPAGPKSDNNNAGDTRALNPAVLSAESPNLKGIVILAVDDDQDTLDFIKLALSRCGADVVTASSSPGALEVLQQRLPDLIISDIGMPGEDGFEFIKKLRGLPVKRGGKIPAIALTAYAGAEHRARVLRSGYQMHLAKPIEPPRLANAAAKVLGRA